MWCDASGNNLALAHVQRIGPGFNSSSASATQRFKHEAINKPSLWLNHGRTGSGGNDSGDAKPSRSPATATDDRDLGGDVGERDFSDVVWHGSRCVLASIDFAAPHLRSAQPPAGRAADHDALLSAPSSLADAPSTFDVVGLSWRHRRSWCPLAFRLVHGNGWLCLWRIPYGGLVDLGKHFVVAIPSAAVPIGHMAHHGREHRCVGWLVVVPRPDDVITRCRTRHRWGNRPTARRCNSL